MTTLERIQNHAESLVQRGAYPERRKTTAFIAKL